MTVSFDYQTPERIALKRKAIPWPALKGKTLLDCGCDQAYWTSLAMADGAKMALGIDRNREMRGRGFVDLIAENSKRCPEASFKHFVMGRQWDHLGIFDVVLVLSVYHHIFEQCGDHLAIWHWLWRHCREQLLWEGPLDDSDVVVQINVRRPGYRRDAILFAADAFFETEMIGPALHEPHRFVYRFTPKEIPLKRYVGNVEKGSGGATIAFEFAEGRRIGEIEKALGFRPVPGSLNVRLFTDFDWNMKYYRVELMDVVNRAQGFASDWAPRWARLYPLSINGIAATALRFEGENYDKKFVELIAPYPLRERLTSNFVMVAQ